jgi:hypothetical protein
MLASLVMADCTSCRSTSGTMATKHMPSDTTNGSAFEATFGACCARYRSYQGQQYDCKNFRFHSLSISIKIISY